MTRHRIDGILPSVAVVAIAASLAGCGGSSKKFHIPTVTVTSASGSQTTSTVSNADLNKSLESASATQIEKAADQAMLKIKTVRMRVQMRRSGRMVVIDIAIVNDLGLTGTMSIDGHAVDVISTGGAVYFKYPLATLKALYPNASAAQTEGFELMAGRWLKTTSATAVSQFSQIANFKKMLSRTSKQKKPDTRGANSTFNGQPVFVIHDADGSTGYVAATGTPYVLKAVPRNANGQLVTLSDFNQPVALKAPAGAITLNGNGSGIGSSVGSLSTSFERSGRDTRV